MKKLILVGLMLLAVAISIRAQEIFDAVKANDVAKVKALVEKDASLVGLADVAGNTPLHLAAKTGSLEMIELLLLKGADINVKNVQLDSPLLAAIIAEKDDAAKLFIMKGADFQKPARGVSPLFQSARRNQREVVELLLAKGADIENGLILNFIVTQPDLYDMAKFFIEKGADVNRKDRNGDTPLQSATIYGKSLRMIDLLLDHGADIDTSNNGIIRILNTAAACGAERLVKFTLEKMRDRKIQNQDESNALMRNALIGGSVEIVKLLQAKNIPLSFGPDIRGRTPLHIVAENDKPEMLEFLVQNGADINQRTKSGKSAFNLAEENGHKELCALIRKLGGNSEPQKFPVLRGPYLGQKPPMNQAEPFAPDIVIANHSTITVSPDGKELYWNSGPKFGDGPIMMTKMVGGKWMKPIEAPFSGRKYSSWDDCPVVTPDNKKMFFISSRPIDGINTGKENIWYVDRTASGWSEPKPVGEEVNAMRLHWQMSVASNGNLYFNSSSPAGNGVFRSSLIDGKYTKPEFTGVNGQSPYISPDETYMIFAKLISGKAVPFICFRSKEGRWGEPIDIQKYIGNGVCCIVSPEGKYVFLDDGWAPAKFIEELRPKEYKNEVNNDDYEKGN